MDLAMAQGLAACGVSTPNPPVGAVVLDAHGVVVGAGHTQPVGGPHAEVMALRQAGAAAAGGTAVVTLEPCDHVGRTGPCTRALLAAGIARVVYAVDDPDPFAGGGAGTLRASGVDVVAGQSTGAASDGALAGWLHRRRTGRPRVTVKIAATVDGRVAAPDGTSRWITGPVSREQVHADRARLDAIVVGTGTVLADDPELTARYSDGSPRHRQPRRIVLGHSGVPAGVRMRSSGEPPVEVRSHDPLDALAAAGDALDVLVEGGPTVLGAFLAAGIVDRVQVYLAPMVLGAGRSAVDDVTVATLTDARRFRRVAVTELGDDILLTLVATP
ncbi:bifunctional diaminohydroxyphosphoribosylaminopyrimidine deaminase/5-amino-6-(5-phosphoribosylamino)uracil reductase RibD [Williamsia deligens]|uniref:Riboflavin biosynthesis protein RibD n=1 Tax=Williamsia deligens TaxID=321325 RepID=A0ABW3GBD3_9NOCA|nr:bifunctional diaminohydroxyphosphoribosylaminopyrimidine deaminase/5-amino-6-(5-phosphoribosylamino)uracil reductase RibD [Williamsia deligens]